MNKGQFLRFPHIADYDVGYKKPPKSSRFSKGHSGNPAGRPRGAKNKVTSQMSSIRDIILSEAYRNVTIQDKSGPLTLPVAQAAMRSLALKAAQGNVGAQKLLLRSLHDAEAEKVNEQIKHFITAVDYKERAYAIIAYNKKHGITFEEVLPHPDHVITDVHKCEVTFIGPIDQKDKELWDKLWKHKAEMEKTIRWQRKYLKKDPDCPQRKKDLAFMYDSLELAEQVIITRWHRSVDEVVKDPKRRDKIRKRVEKGIIPKMLK